MPSPDSSLRSQGWGLSGGGWGELACSDGPVLTPPLWSWGAFWMADTSAERILGNLAPSWLLRANLCPAVASVSMEASSLARLRWWKGVWGLFCCLSPFSGFSPPVLCLVGGWDGWPADWGWPVLLAVRCLTNLYLQESKNREMQWDRDVLMTRSKTLAHTESLLREVVQLVWNFLLSHRIRCSYKTSISPIMLTSNKAAPPPKFIPTQLAENTSRISSRVKL